MNKKYLSAVLTVFFLLGLSGAVYAASDPDDSLLDPYEIVAADVLLYEPVITEPGALYAKVSLTMDGKLPGAFMLDLDLDGNTATGGGGLHYSLSACNGAGPIDGAVNGTDISIYVVLDNQAYTSPAAWCAGCTAPGGCCFYKDTQCSQSNPQCGTADCYKGADSCNPGDSNCYFTGNQCSPPEEPACDICFEMEIECAAEIPCDNGGRARGEWIAYCDNPILIPPRPYARGKIEMPLPPQGGPNANADALCITLPYSRIITDTKAAGAIYDEVKALDSANVRWHISAWEDGAPGGVDYVNEALICYEVVDKIPDSGNLPVTVNANPAYVFDECHGDYDKDGDVKDGPDIIQFKANMGRFSTFDPCPDIICP